MPRKIFEFQYIIIIIHEFYIRIGLKIDFSMVVPTYITSSPNIIMDDIIIVMEIKRYIFSF